MDWHDFDADETEETFATVKEIEMIDQAVTLTVTRAEASTLMHLLGTEERKLERRAIANRNRLNERWGTHAVDRREAEEIVELSQLRQKIHDQI